MKKILVPTDFSKPAKWAAEVATNIAGKSGAEITLLHIVELPMKESFNAEGQIAEFSDWDDKIFTLKLIERDKIQLDLIAKEIEAAGVPVRQELKLGNAFHGMISTITGYKVDLVVMGTSGRSKTEQMLVGSNTEKVVRYSKCPVLTIHQEPCNRNVKHIVYATSLSENEKAFSDVIRNAQEMYDATVHVVRINTPMNFKPDTDIKRSMKNFAVKARLKNYTLNIFNDFSEEEGILNFASSINADLIGMATQGRTGFAHMIRRSIAEDVVTLSERPVLTYVTKNA